MGTVLKIVSWPYRMVKRNAAAAISRIRSNTALGKVLDSMSLVPLGGSVIMILVSLIMFIIQNGFGIQIDTIKSKGLWDAISSSSGSSVWTKGTSGYFYNVWICAAIGLVFLTLTVFAAIDVYRHGSTGKKVAFTITAAFLAAGIATLVFGLTAFIDAVLLPFIGLGEIVVSGIVLMVILSKNGFFKSAFINTLFYLTAAPLTVLIVENLIGLVAFAVVMIVMAVALIFFGSALGSGSSESAAPAPAAAKADPAAEKALKKKQGRMAQLQNEIENLNDSIDGYNHKRLGYFGVDPDYCRRKRAEKLLELEQLRAQA